MANIAWIEDDHGRIASLLELVKEDGHRVEPYGSIAQVEDNVDKIINADLIVLDIILPPVEDDPYQGLTLLKKLRQTHEFEGPIIVCTRVRNPNVLGELPQLGVPREQLLQKPTLPSKMRETVRILLEQQKSDLKPEL